VTIDYNGSLINLGIDRRESVSWRLQPKPFPDINEEVLHEVLNDVPIEIRKELEITLREFPGQIGNTLGSTKTIKQKLDVGNHKPVRGPVYRYNEEKTKILCDLVRELEREGRIEPSQSAWSSPPVLVTKPDGSTRLCVNFKKINDLSEDDAYPMPDLLLTNKGLRGAKVFSSIDLRKGYYQVELEEGAKELTAFTTPLGLYQFTVTPFGLKGAPRTFQRLMNEVLRAMIGVFVTVYIDDILIYSHSLQEHLCHLQQVMERLRMHGLSFNLKKCRFAKPSLTYLGRTLDGNGIGKIPERLECIARVPPPQGKKDVRKFLGQCQWYAEFVHHYTEKVAPLTDLLTQGPWRWTEKEQQSFELIKHGILGAPKLCH